MTRRPGRAGLVAALSGVLVAPLLLLPATPSVAGNLPPATSGPAADSGRKTTTSGTCTIYGSANGFGAVCNTGGGGALTIAQLLDGGPFPGCWNEELPLSFTPPREARPGRTWWQRTCITGIDRQTYRRTGPVRLVISFVDLLPDEVVTLTTGEETAVARFVGRGQIPFPIITATPTPSPRVTEPTSISLLRKRTPDLQVAGVTMYAEAIRLKVDPGDGGPVVDCDGGGARLTAEQIGRLPASSDEACLMVYSRSSALEGTGIYKDRYSVTVTALWEIHYIGADGVDRVLGRYEKTAVNLLRVTEIQTLVTS